MTTVRTQGIVAVAVFGLLISGCRHGSLDRAADGDGSAGGAPTSRATTRTAGGIGMIDPGRTQYSRIEDLLVGRVAGLYAVQGSSGRVSVRIRGVHSILGNNEPLYVIDGIPISPSSVDAALASIHPRDVARMDVLKDAGAMSMYGSRATAGVIIITTRRGP